MVLWLGAALPAGFYGDVFGVAAPPPDAGALRLEPPRPGSELAARIAAVMAACRGAREVYQECFVVRQGTPMEAHVGPYFVEDRQASAGAQGYLDFMLTLQKAVMSLK